ncbi:MAG: M16 family metallopeptidase [Anaerolineae bacterium]
MTDRSRSSTRRSSSSLPGPDDTLRRTLPNGITLLVRENFASPAVVVNGHLEMGAEDEPPDKRGITGFTTDVMQRGTRNRSFSELYEEVESIGAAFGMNNGAHITSFGAKGLAGDLSVLLSILNDVLRNPIFPERQVEKARTEILTDIQERQHDTRRTARRIFYELTYPESHPYHWSQMGYAETISRITRDDLAAYHQTYASPQGMVVIVVGGIEAEEAAAALTDTFGSWEADRPKREPLVPVPSLSERRERAVVIEDKSQTSVVIGWPGPRRLDDDYIPCFVANTVLGVFGMYGRLGTHVRDEHGLAYYIYSRLEGGTGPGPWRILGGFEPANVNRGVALVLDEVRRLQDETVPQEELQDSLSYLTGSLPLHLETNEGVARSLINIERYRLGLDYLQRYQSIIEAVTPDQVQAAAQRWLDAENLAMATAGPSLPDF